MSICLSLFSKNKNVISYFNTLSRDSFPIAIQVQSYATMAEKSLRALPWYPKYSLLEMNTGLLFGKFIRTEPYSMKNNA